MAGKAQGPFCAYGRKDWSFYRILYEVLAPQGHSRRVKASREAIGLRGKGLGWGQVRRQRPSLGDGPLLDGNQGFARFPMEQVNKTHLATLSNGRDGAFALSLKGQKNRRGGGVKIPKIPMHELEVPANCPACAI